MCVGVCVCVCLCMCGCVGVFVCVFVCVVCAHVHVCVSMWGYLTSAERLRTYCASGHTYIHTHTTCTHNTHIHTHTQHTHTHTHTQLLHSWPPPAAKVKVLRQNCLELATSLCTYPTMDRETPTSAIAEYFIMSGCPIAQVIELITSLAMQSKVSRVCV